MKAEHPFGKSAADKIFFRSRNFTLIELLIIIAIIAILSGMLLPALNKAKKSAQKILCVNNLMQIGKAVQLYASSYGDIIPAWKSAVETANSDRIWCYKLLEFCSNNPTLWYCPDSPAWNIPGDKKNPDNMSFFMNIGINGINWADQNMYAFYDHYIKQTRIKAPSRLHYAGDGVGNNSHYYFPANGNTYCLTYRYIYSPAATGEQVAAWTPRHNGSINFLYCDGHSESEVSGKTATSLQNLFNSSGIRNRPMWLAEY